jgi:hypothetical protein
VDRLTLGVQDRTGFSTGLSPWQFCFRRHAKSRLDSALELTMAIWARSPSRVGIAVGVAVSTLLSFDTRRHLGRSLAIYVGDPSMELGGRR